MSPSQGSPFSSNKLLAYMVVGIFTFALWGVAYLIWREAYIWYAWVTEWTAVVTLLVLPIPYWVHQSMLPSADGRRAGIMGWAEDWLRWMGNGERHRGTLVLLVCVFWSMLYWNWPVPAVREFPFVLTFPLWGLLTIFGLVTIRTLFFRQTQLPGQEVPAPDMKKSLGK